MNEDRREAEMRELHRAVARLRASVMAIVFGGAGGAVVFLATAWLLIRGGRVVGPHLSLLSNYFPGYHVSWPGALVGLVYGAMCGAVAGWSVAWVYNLVVAVRQRP